MKIFDKTRANELLEQAAANPRRRINYNFHESTEDPINRLCIAAWPDSKFDIQSHPGKWELLTVLTGSATSYCYDDDGNVIAENRLGDGADVFTIEIPENTWHNLVVHTPCVFLEVKPGPFSPSLSFPEKRK